MNKKTKTISLQGKEYATVPARLKEFREANPQGLIETKPEFKEGGQVLFTCRVLKDKANPASGEATGHAIGKVNKDKDFEKLETISVGRALAMLGYLASGEIASGEEMQDFYEYREVQKQDAFDKLEACLTLDELKDCYLSLGSLMGDKDIIAKKDELKTNITQNANS